MRIRHARFRSTRGRALLFIIAAEHGAGGASGKRFLRQVRRTVAIASRGNGVAQLNAATRRMSGDNFPWFLASLPGSVSPRVAGSFVAVVGEKIKKRMRSAAGRNLCESARIEGMNSSGILQTAVKLNCAD